ncbi:MAG: DUF4340 domain-containing protein [Acetobacteraceae bacterium]|nr:DUF4340 domain-containing protein [Acetobacteraceae bacterium]
MAAPLKRRTRAIYTGFAAGLAMIALIAAISFTGRWPEDMSREGTPLVGILNIPAKNIERITLEAGGDKTVFERRGAHLWRSNGADLGAAIAGHIDLGLRLLNVSSPLRVLDEAEYSREKLAEFGLASPRLRLELFQSTGAPTEVIFGENTPTQTTQFARLTGQPQIYLLSRYVGTEWQLALDMLKRAWPSETAAAHAALPAALFLLPVSLESIGATEIVSGGNLVRFERDPDGVWFHHTGQHTHAMGGYVHKADPKFAPAIDAELKALEQANIERIIALHPDKDSLSQYGLEHPPLILLLYTPDSSRPVARVEFGAFTEDHAHRYVRVAEQDAVATVAPAEATPLANLLRIAEVSKCSLVSPLSPQSGQRPC